MPEAALAEFFPELLAIAACLLVSAFFSGTETALTSLNEARVHQLLERHPGARSLHLWLTRPAQVLTALLIGNNIVNILSSALATKVATKLFSNQGLGIAVGIMTLLLLIFGEITPKTFAKHNADRLALAAMPLVKMCYYVFFPLVIVLSALARGVVRFSGGKVTAPDTAVTEQDIEFLIDLGKREGVLEEHEPKMLHSVLDLSETQVRAVMVPRTNMVALPAEIAREELLQVVVEAGYSRVPIFQGSVDSIIGILHLKDLLRELQAGNRDFFDLKALLRPVYYVPESMKINVLLREFQRRKTHIAVVVDEYGGTAGIVAMEDIIEEIVGEIQDEYDVEEKQLKRLADGRYLADARLGVDDLAEILGVAFPDGEGYETPGGFVTALPGRLP